MIVSFTGRPSCDKSYPTTQCEVYYKLISGTYLHIVPFVVVTTFPE